MSLTEASEIVQGVYARNRKSGVTTSAFEFAAMAADEGKFSNVRTFLAQEVGKEVDLRHLTDEQIEAIAKEFGGKLTEQPGGFATKCIEAALA